MRLQLDVGHQGAEAACGVVGIGNERGLAWPPALAVGDLRHFQLLQFAPEAAQHLIKIDPLVR